MKVRCIANLGINMSKQSIKAGRPVDSVFHLNVGDLYMVYGINLWKGTLNYLTMNQAGSRPIWSPAELFRVEDDRIPPDWHYKYLGTSEELLNAAWGYRELVESGHYDGIQTGEGKALDIFFERKKAIDKYFQDNPA